MKSFILLLLSFGSLVAIAGATELIPVVAWTNGEVYSPEYSVDKMLDGNSKTYVCFLDDTRTGS